MIPQPALFFLALTAFACSNYRGTESGRACAEMERVQKEVSGLEQDNQRLQSKITRLAGREGDNSEEISQLESAILANKQRMHELAADTRAAEACKPMGKDPESKPPQRGEPGGY